MHGGSGLRGQLIIDRVNTLAHRRAICLTLELAAVRLEQGFYPSHLTQAGEIAALDRLDPFTGQPFPYRPEGFPSSLRWYHGHESMPAQPVLWAGVQPSVTTEAQGKLVTHLKWTDSPHWMFFPPPAVYLLPQFADVTADAD